MAVPIKIVFAPRNQWLRPSQTPTTFAEIAPQPKAIRPCTRGEPRGTPRVRLLARSPRIACGYAELDMILPSDCAKALRTKLETGPALQVMSSSQHQGCFSWQSFWKAGSERKGSQIGSSLRSAGVTGVPYNQLIYGVCNNRVRVEIAWLFSPNIV
jgi:hypothetical protein